MTDTTNAFRRGFCLGGKLAAFGLFSALGVAVASAQEKEQTSGTSKISFESELHSSFVGRSDFRQRDNRGNVSTWDIGTRDVVSFQAHEGFLVRFGLEVERYNFGVPNKLALPTKLQEASLVIGADFQIGDAWILRVETTPGFYSGGTNVRSGNVSAPVIVGASYFVSSDLQLVAGLSIDANRKYVVLPGIGFRYKCNADWVLDCILPAPRIEYNFSKSILFYAGGDLQGATYRVDPDFGTNHDNPKLNNAWVDYSQVRVGVGASWKLRPDVTLEMEAGIVPVQEFDFHRAEIRASSTEIPPYGGIVLKAAF
jgi:hypothetical protein